MRREDVIKKARELNIQINGVLVEQAETTRQFRTVIDASGNTVSLLREQLTRLLDSAAKG